MTDKKEDSQAIVTVDELFKKNKIDLSQDYVENFQQSYDDGELSIEELDDVEGIGEIRAKNIKRGLTRMQEQFLYESRFYR